ncbi:hypothetical protein [Bacillus weihaiensis]|uniref:N-acetyltransferase domain-containing protein n=1 Tax=Bacillus weihaiensis TaxID=1547283 RepID=A0A1L3MTC5_9BACI|nr:hypothetical protein [Bacillus weihaiensis]APH05592.1 hypothetical protein A9C19_12985 [Bacillus weihaiensis]
MFKLLEDNQRTNDPEELKEELEDLEFQVFRMQDNLKEIAKKSKVLGVDQTKEDKMVIVYTPDESSCKIMLCDCETAYKGQWDFSIQATLADEETIHIGDIKGPANKGYGSICMDYLKDLAIEQNIPKITGDIAKRDWDHVERLVHFYQKHNFYVEIDYDRQYGEIKWVSNS